MAKARRTAKPKVRDYATEYAKAVVSGKKECACKAEILACKRHLADLKRKDLEWRPEEAEKHIEFAEYLQIYIKNEKRYVPLQLRGFQKFILCNLFGWYKNGIRRFTEAYIQIGRKNGKSFLNSFLCLDFSTLSAIKDGQIYTAGTNYANASIVWQDCKALIEADERLNQFFAIKDYSDSRSKIINKQNGTKIIPLSGDTKKDGFLPYLACVDEYHLHETDDMYNVLLDGQVGLNNSLLAVITTAGKNLNNPCYRQYKYAKSVLEKVIKADELFVYISEIDLPDPHKHEEEYNKTLWDKTNWAQANPLLLYDDDYHVTKDVNKWKDFESIAEKAKKEEGTTLNNFIIKKLDVWTTIGTDAYVNADDWAACATEKIPDISGMKCYIGLDLSSKNDLSSFSVVFPAQGDLNVPYIYSHSFLPKGSLQKHIMRDKLAYDRLALAGYVSLTDCNGTNAFILDYKFIASFLKGFIKENKLEVLMLGYDAMGIGGIMQDLDDIPCEKVEIGQYPKSMNETTRNFQGTVQGRALTYDANNELLSWSVRNAVAVLNSKKEMLIDKKFQRNRIDPIDAVLDAWKCMHLAGTAISQEKKNMQTIDDWINLMKEL